MVKSDASRLVLGTAQLGMRYGIANRSGRPSADRAREIVLAAWEAGMRSFDTSPGYGDSEAVLGTTLADLGLSRDALVTTKLHPDLDHDDSRLLAAAAFDSLRRLGVERLHCLMLHRERFLDHISLGLADTLKGLVDDGVTSHVGISVYSPERAMQALAIPVITAVQVPANVLDRRFREAGVFRLAEETGKTVVIRSAFLQGLLLMDPADVPPAMALASEVVQAFSDFCRDAGMTRQEACLGYLKVAYPTSPVIFGAEMPEQVRENCRAWTGAASRDAFAPVETLFTGVDTRILNPSLWPK